VVRDIRDLYYQICCQYCVARCNSSCHISIGFGLGLRSCFADHQRLCLIHLDVGAAFTASMQAHAYLPVIVR
jgi:hypothetical protein